jgi:predicted O-methyltransferase YrrM
MITLTGELSAVLTQLAAQLGLDAAALNEYANADPHPRMGWDTGTGEAPVGSMFSVEGRVLYALVRLFKPENVIELGTCVGASSTHILAGMEDNKVGKLVSVDNKAQLGAWKVGQLIPAKYRARVQLVTADGIEYLSRVTGSVDMVFEDMMHSAAQVSKIAAFAKEHLVPGGWLISHDANHFIVGHEVREGYEAAGLEPIIIMPAPSDCGFAIWRKPEVKPAPEVKKAQESEWPTMPQPSSAASGARSSARKAK